MTKKKKTLIIIVIIALITSLIFFIGYMIRTKNYGDKIDATIISDVDLTTIADGTYTGTYDVDFISAKVEVIVEKNIIKNITLLEHHNDRGAAASTITETMVEEQKIDVDAIASATNSSKVIKKAVENALTL